ncbi:hypothetical protein E3N88_40304 [Mikania micrantha]|uniref:Uncharacterized protein n=1 Tax=Mikania micrantha TaxID=192012 RepID=A0A5N6LMC0_9ASTR|nr:hypothetical protein E3N88_40304 [Mikania micrantha]
MSRCFPYPPPGHFRNGATYEALIESIKLQKGTNKTKAERKKEKKAKKEEKKRSQKENGNSQYEVKVEKNINGDSHKLDKSADYTKATKKTKIISKLFEKSDLTEEHGPAIGSHQPSYSSDSTQNSNKRKRDDSSVLHDSSISHGSDKPIKIRLLKRHKESDFSKLCADTMTNAYPLVLPSSNSDRSPASTSRMNGVSATSGWENRIQAKSNLISEGSMIRDPSMLHFDRMQSVTSSTRPIYPSGSKKSNMELQKSPKQTILRFERHVLPSNCLEQEIPSSSLSRYVDEQNLHFCRQQQQVPSHHGMCDSVSNKTSTSAAGKRSDHETASTKKQKQEMQKVGPTRFEKKMLKKHSKYEKLVGSLFPLVLQAHLPGDDDDWLCRSKTSSSSTSKGEVETCHQLVAPWQPCARYLAEVDVHALPYTVPF